jgi:hypothetical protein
VPVTPAVPRLSRRFFGRSRGTLDCSDAAGPRGGAFVAYPCRTEPTAEKRLISSHFYRALLGKHSRNHFRATAPAREMWRLRLLEIFIAERSSRLRSSQPIRVSQLVRTNSPDKGKTFLQPATIHIVAALACILPVQCHHHRCSPSVPVSAVPANTPHPAPPCLSAGPRTADKCSLGEEELVQGVGDLLAGEVPQPNRHLAFSTAQRKAVHAMPAFPALPTL